MIALLTLFNVITLVALFDLNKRVYELEQQEKRRAEIDGKIKDLLVTLQTTLEVHTALKGEAPWKEAP